MLSIIINKLYQLYYFDAYIIQIINEIWFSDYSFICKYFLKSKEEEEEEIELLDRLD